MRNLNASQVSHFDGRSSAVAGLWHKLSGHHHGIAADPDAFQF